MGHHYNLIPNSVPFEGGFAEISLSDEDSKRDNFKTTNELLKEVVTDKSKFCELYRVSISFYEIHLGHYISSITTFQIQSSNRFSRDNDGRSGCSVLVYFPSPYF